MKKNHYKKYKTENHAISKITLTVLFFLLILTISCNEDSQTKENSVESDEISVQKTVKLETTSPTEPTPTPTAEPTPTPEEVDVMFSTLSTLKANYEKAVREKNGELLTETKSAWDEEEKKLRKITEKYGIQAVYKTPIGDCQEFFYQMYQAYFIFWTAAIGEADDRSIKSYREDKKILKKFFEECKSSMDTARLSNNKKVAS